MSDDEDGDGDGDEDDPDGSRPWSVVRRHQPLKKHCCRGRRFGSKGCLRESQPAGAAPCATTAARWLDGDRAAPKLQQHAQMARRRYLDIVDETRSPVAISCRNLPRADGAHFRIVKSRLQAITTDDLPQATLVHSPHSPVHWPVSEDLMIDVLLRAGQRKNARQTARCISRLPSQLSAKFRTSLQPRLLTIPQK